MSVKGAAVLLISTNLFSWMPSKTRIFWEGCCGSQPFLTDIFSWFSVQRPVYMHLESTASLKIRVKLETGTL